MPASYPGSVKTFTTKVNGVDAPDAAHINDLQLEVAAVETDLLEAATDYSSLSTVNGFSSYTTKEIYYKKIGKLVFVQFRIAGTSNANNFSFSLPYNAAAAIAPNTHLIGDNGNRDWGRSSMSSGSATVTIFKSATATSTAWTTSGTKEAFGQFFYFTN